MIRRLILLTGLLDEHTLHILSCEDCFEKFCRQFVDILSES